MTSIRMRANLSIHVLRWQKPITSPGDSALSCRTRWYSLHVLNQKLFYFYIYLNVFQKSDKLIIFKRFFFRSFRCSTPSCFICCRRKMPIGNGDDEMVSVAQEVPGTPLGFRSGNGEKLLASGNGEKRLASGNGSDQQPDAPEQDNIADNPSASCLDKLCDPCTLM